MSKILIENHDLGTEKETLIVRDSLSTKDILFKLIEEYIKTNNNLEFNENKHKPKHLLFGKDKKPSIYECNTNNYIIIKDPNLISFIKENYDRDTFKLTSKKSKIEKNEEEATKQNQQQEKYTKSISKHTSWKDSKIKFASSPYIGK